MCLGPSQGRTPPPGSQGCGGGSEGWAVLPAGIRTSVLVLSNSSSGHGEGQQQGFTQDQHCWSCGELEEMGETAGLGQNPPQDGFSRTCPWQSWGCQLSQGSIPPHPVH